MIKYIETGEIPEKKNKKPIEFTLVMDADRTFKMACLEPKGYKKNYLLQRGYTKDGLDLMYAQVASTGALYLGLWNDGVV